MFYVACIHVANLECMAGFSLPSSGIHSGAEDIIDLQHLQKSSQLGAKFNIFELYTADIKAWV